MGFRLVPKSVTLNDLEERNGHYFAELSSFRGHVKVANSPEKCHKVHQQSTTDALCSSR